MQAKITSSETLINELTKKAEDLERANESLAARARELELAAHVAAQNAAAAGVGNLPLPPPVACVLRQPLHALTNLTDGLPPPQCHC